MFVRGGNVNPGDYLDYAGDYGNYWSSVGLNRYDAYALSFNPSRVLPSTNDGRHDGYSVRCVALGG